MNIQCIFMCENISHMFTDLMFQSPQIQIRKTGLAGRAFRIERQSPRIILACGTSRDCLNFRRLRSVTSLEARRPFPTHSNLRSCLCTLHPFQLQSLVPAIAIQPPVDLYAPLRAFHRYSHAKHETEVVGCPGGSFVRMSDCCSSC